MVYLTKHFKIRDMLPILEQLSMGSSWMQLLCLQLEASCLRRRLVSGDGVHISATFSRPERGRWTIANGDPFSACSRSWKMSATTTQAAREENLQRETLALSTPTPTVDMEMLEKLANTTSTIVILWPIKAIFEKSPATVEVDMGDWFLYTSSAGRHCPFWHFSQRCVKFRVLRAQDFYTPLALNCQKGQRLPALEVYKHLGGSA